jgi:NADH-quinone oxidoreductase subunit C
MTGDPAAVLGELARSRPKPNEFVVERVRIGDACERLRAAGYEHLCLITGIDWNDRWEVLYHLVAFDRKDHVVLRSTLPRHDPSIPSVARLWPGASWHERETYDLLGIRFPGTPDERRILLPEDYDGFPLRKEVLFGNRS